MSTAYLTKIVSALNRLGQNGTANPDGTHNTGSMLGEAYLWDAVEAFAKGRSKKAWEALENEGVIIPPDVTGEHALATSPHFVCSAKVTNPVRRFNADELAKLLKKQYKIPEPVSKALIEQAKVGTKPAVSYSIMERADS